MSALLALALAAPLLGLVGRGRPSAVAALLLSLAAGLALALGGASTPLRLGPLVADDLNAALLPAAALIALALALAAPRLILTATNRRRWLLAAALTQGTLAAADPLTAAAFALLSLLPMSRGLGERSPRARRVFLVYMLPAGALTLGGAALLYDPARAPLGAALLALAVLARKGVLPLHGWMPEAFERGPLPANLLFSAPQVAAALGARFVLPDAPEAVLQAFGLLALLTAVYGAAQSAAQRDPRRAFGFLFLSQSALVVAGLESAHPVALAGGLLCWLATSLALTAFGLTLWILEARRGAMGLDRLHGGHDRTPVLAAAFLLTGLASVGFPGTLGFVGGELLIEGAVERFRLYGFAVVLAAGLGAVTVMRMYLALFTGAPDRRDDDLALLPREGAALAPLLLVLVVGGLWPAPLARWAEGATRQVIEARGAARALRTAVGAETAAADRWSPRPRG